MDLSTAMSVASAEVISFNRRIAALVKAGYLVPAGGDLNRTSYRVVGGKDEYLTASESMMK